MINNIGNIGQISANYATGAEKPQETTTSPLAYIYSNTETTETEKVETSTSTNSANQPISWGTDYQQAMAQAAAEGRQVIVIFGRPECGNCTRTENNANNSAEVRALINDNYIAVHVNIDTPEGRAAFTPLRAGMGDMILPLTCIIDPTNPSEYSARTTRTQKADSLIAMLEQGMDGKPSPNGTHYTQNSSGGNTTGTDGVVRGLHFDIEAILADLTSDILADVLNELEQGNILQPQNEYATPTVQPNNAPVVTSAPSPE